MLLKTPRVSSALKAVDLRQNPAPLIIGERLNAQGSKKAKECVLNDNFEELVKLARDQVEDGAHCLDVCVATTERSDELEFMKKLVKLLSLEIDAPLVIDSTEPKVIASALEQIPGKPIINSINLEGDGSRFHLLAPLMVKYGVPAVSMCIGPKGMAKTPREKLETAELLVETGKKYGLTEEHFIFDVLTFTLATGEAEFLDAGKNTLEGIRLVKEKFPNSFTTLGLSNVSFGLSPRARKILNAVFLYHAVKYGLDTVIINPKDVIPYTEIDDKEKKLAEDLIFNKHPNALADYIAYFENIKGTVQTTKKVDVDPTWPAGKRANFRIVNRLRDGIENDVVSAIADKITTKFSLVEKNGRLEIDAPRDMTHQAAIVTLNEDLLPAMKEVGDKFGSGELILPFVLKSAECMKAAVSELEKYLIKQEGMSKGKLVLCTVYGDVHDIGKNLVKTILSNNGYQVFDLGKQVPIPTIANKIKEINADVVGLSALLVSTSKQMQLFTEFVRENNINIPILCGGAAINSDYINRIAKGDGSNIYKPGIFYCKTAFDGLKFMNNIMSENRDQFIENWTKKIQEWSERKYDKKTDLNSNFNKEISIVPVVKDKPIPPAINQIFRFSKKDIPLDQVWQLLNKKSLFVLSWGLRGKSATSLQTEFDQLLNHWKSKVIEENLFEPQAVYGYFKCKRV